jgi:hypothetical protein
MAAAVVVVVGRQKPDQRAQVVLVVVARRGANGNTAHLSWLRQKTSQWVLVAQEGRARSPVATAVAGSLAARQSLRLGQRRRSSWRPPVVPGQAAQIPG